MPKMICFDMDGTIADLYAVPGWLEKLRAEDATPYRDAPPMWDMARLREALIALVDDGWEIRVISWLAKDSTPAYKKAVRAAKREWLTRYNFPANKVHLVAYGTTKANAIRNAGAAPGILIDDNKKVRDGWSMGDAIDPLSTDDLPTLLEGLLTE